MSGTSRVVRVTVVGGWWPTVMEPHLFPECVICQVHAFGCPLRRGSLFCVIPGNPTDCCFPPPPQSPLSSLCAFTYSCPTGCSETDWHPQASEGRGPLLSSTTLGSMAAATADGLWRLNHQAHGSYWGLAIVKFKGRLLGHGWIAVMRPNPPSMNLVHGDSARYSLSNCRIKVSVCVIY